MATAEAPSREHRPLTAHEQQLAAEAAWKMPPVTPTSIVSWGASPNSREWDIFIVCQVREREIAGMRLHFDNAGSFTEFKGNASHYLDPINIRLPERHKDEDAGVWRETPVSELAARASEILAFFAQAQEMAKEIGRLHKRVDESEGMIRAVDTWLKENGPHVRALREASQKGQKPKLSDQTS